MLEQDWNAARQPRKGLRLENPIHLAVTATGTTLDSASPQQIQVDTTAGAFSVLLPASPYEGMTFTITDAAAAGSFAAANLTVNGNGKNINAAATLVLSDNFGVHTFRYNGTFWSVDDQSAGGGTSSFANLTVTTLLTMAAGADVTAAAGATDVDYSASTGLLKTPTGTNTINGTVSIAANKNVACVAGTTALDLSLGTGATLTTTGLNTLGGDTIIAAGKIFGFGTPQALSGAGAVNVTSLVTLFTSTGGAQALTLANGTQTGQIKFIVHVVDGGSGVCTPTTKTNFTTITLTDVYDWAAVIWDGAAWRPLAHKTSSATAVFA